MFVNHLGHSISTIFLVFMIYPVNYVAFMFIPTYLLTLSALLTLLLLMPWTVTPGHTSQYNDGTRVSTVRYTFPHTQRIRSLVRLDRRQTPCTPVCRSLRIKQLSR